MDTFVESADLSHATIVPFCTSSSSSIGSSAKTLESEAKGGTWKQGGRIDASASDQKRGASPFLQAWGQAAHRRQVIAICRRHDARMECKSNNSVVCSCKYHVVFCVDVHWEVTQMVTGS